MKFLLALWGKHECTSQAIEKGGCSKAPTNLFFIFPSIKIHLVRTWVSSIRTPLGKHLTQQSHVRGEHQYS
jgi:hypothetical protein